MIKKTSEDWPDQSEWAKRLFERLEEHGAGFIQASWEPLESPADCEGLNLKQVLTGHALLQVCFALRELPPFEKSRGVAVLHTLATAMDELANGGDPRLLRSTMSGTRGGDGTARRYVRSHVLRCLRFLVEDHGIADAAARKEVARIYADAGATGRKGKPLSASTINDWNTRTHPDSMNQHDAKVHAEIEERLALFRAHPNYPGTYEEALQWVYNLANDPLIKSKYG